MGPDEQFRDYVKEVAAHAQQRKAELERKIAELESERAMLTAHRDAIGDLPQRVRDYPVKLGADYACPQCWGARGALVPVKPIPSKTDNDLFRCHICDLTFEIEYTR